MKNKRLWTRSVTEARGNFLTKDRDIFGDMHLNNYSRKGFRASLNRPVELGTDLFVEVTLPRHNMPVWATGKVVWTKNNKDKENCEAGVELKEIDLFDTTQVIDESYKDKYLEQVADYAYEVGAYTKNKKNSFFKTSCSSAAMFVIFFFLGSAMTFLNSYFALIYALTTVLYFSLLIYKKRNLLLNKKFSLNLLFNKKTMLRISGLILNNLCCGINYLRGYIFGAKIKTRQN